jgi:regulator of sigma E protease
MNVIVLFLGLLSFLLVFTVIVFVHEMGHFLAARFLGFKVEAFSIGFGKPIVQWRDKLGTQWRISQLPLGGFVKFAGDTGASSVPDAEHLDEIRDTIGDVDPKTSGIYHFMPVWKRAIVAAAGPIMNFVFAILVFSILLMSYGSPQISPKIGAVTQGSAAERAGFLNGDQILKVNGEAIDNWQRVVAVVSISANDPMNFVVERDGHEVEIVAIPDAVLAPDPFGKIAEKGQLGMAINPGAEVKRVTYNPIQAVAEGSSLTKKAIVDQIAFVSRLLRGRGSPEMLGGPLRIAYIAGKVGAGNMTPDATDQRTLAQRLLGLVWLAAGLSVAIGLINLAPVPMLDGGHLVFYAYEAVAGRPLPERLQIIGYKVGISAVICLLAFATFNDLRYFNVFVFFGKVFS